MKKGYTHTTIAFKVDDKPISFVIVHDMPDIKGLSINDAAHN